MLFVFAQGCTMRCKFCSNPDTWSPCAGEVVSSKDIAAQLRRWVACCMHPFFVLCHGWQCLSRAATEVTLIIKVALLALDPVVVFCLPLTQCRTLPSTWRWRRHMQWR